MRNKPLHSNNVIINNPLSSYHGQTGIIVGESQSIYSYDYKVKLESWHLPLKFHEKELLFHVRDVMDIIS